MRELQFLDLVLTCLNLLCLDLGVGEGGVTTSSFFFFLFFLVTFRFLGEGNGGILNGQKYVTILTKWHDTLF